MCSFCFHRIVDSEGNKCPACRRSYNPDNYVHIQLKAQEYVFSHVIMPLLIPSDAMFASNDVFVCASISYHVFGPLTYFCIHLSLL
jgi:hypothetical protein